LNLWYSYNQVKPLKPILLEVVSGNTP